ncbi:hypothetical protein SK128_012533 [Halocaridina rubra]|uniref:Kinetochore protein SPC25 n=1 Tax=Halocaridina rubra TaxID=373956 RepID=A0AAN8ZSH5_HALRR
MSILTFEKLAKVYPIRKITMANENILDYDIELEHFHQKLSLNSKSFEKRLNEVYGLVKERARREEAVITKTEGKINELRKKIDNIQDNVHSVKTDKDRAAKEKQRITEEYENLNRIISEKKFSLPPQDRGLAKLLQMCKRDELRELLTRIQQRLEERKQQVEFEESKHREKITNMEIGMLLYQKHLGLKIQRTRHNTLAFIFTQIRRMDPEKEYVVEMTLEGDNYHLTRSEPPLPELQELEDRLNASNNLSACFVHVRRLFQKMEE